MKPMTEDRRQELLYTAKELLNRRNIYGSDIHDVKAIAEITLAALTADTSKLTELAAKVRKVREDASEFDGDRRGMWEYQEEQERLLLEEAVKYTTPPVPVIKLPEKYSDHEGFFTDTEQGYNDAIDEIKRLNGLS